MIRELMKEWKKLKLGNIAVISYGYTAKASVANIGLKHLSRQRENYSHHSHHFSKAFHWG